MGAPEDTVIRAPDAVIRDNIASLLRVPSGARTKIATLVLLGSEQPLFYYGPLFGHVPDPAKFNALRETVREANRTEVSYEALRDLATLHELLPAPTLVAIDRTIITILRNSMADHDRFNASAIHRAGLQMLVRIHSEYFLPYVRWNADWTLVDTAYAVMCMMTSYRPLLRIERVYGSLGRIFEVEAEHALLRLATEENLLVGSRKTIEFSPLFATILMHIAF